MSENISILYSEEEVQARVKDLAAQISKEYYAAGKKNIHVICILKGAMFFACDLARQLQSEINVIMDVARVSSYGSGTESSGIFKEFQPPTKSLTGHDVLVIEDIIDSGKTMKYLLEEFFKAQPTSIKVCSLLDKPSRREVPEIQPDYCGFEIPDEFVVGYGLDYDEKYRNLPYIGILSLD